MNKDTKAIVASNLTLALYAGQATQSDTARNMVMPGGNGPDVERVFAVYQEFIAKLTPPPDPDAGKVEHGEGLWNRE